MNLPSQAPAARSVIKYSANGIVTAELANVSIAIWRRKPTREMFDQQKRCLDDVVAKFPGEAAFICVVESTSEPPEDELRRASTSMITAHERNLKGVALVIEGTGFRSAITRTVLSGMVMLARTPTPIKFFDTPASACVWVGSLLHLPRETLIDEIISLRVALDAQ